MTRTIYSNKIIVGICHRVTYVRTTGTGNLMRRTSIQQKIDIFLSIEWTPGLPETNENLIPKSFVVF